MDILGLIRGKHAEQAGDGHPDRNDGFGLVGPQRQTGDVISQTMPRQVEFSRSRAMTQFISFPLQADSIEIVIADFGDGAAILRPSGFVGHRARAVMV